MGLLTPSHSEYNVLNDFIFEALKLWGQDCMLYAVDSKVEDTDMDDVYFYKDPIKTSLLFVDDIVDVKLKNKTHWSKEKGDYIEAYISLDNASIVSKGAIIDITPMYYNSNAKFIVANVFGQINSIYAKITLVPYRESLKTSTQVDKKVDEKIKEGGIVKPRPFLKR